MIKAKLTVHDFSLVALIERLGYALSTSSRTKRGLKLDGSGVSLDRQASIPTMLFPSLTITAHKQVLGGEQTN